ncbi:hypothetical protein H8B02_18245 [Bradyrhizobium sp. Pear77]|uniref:hypothetical protein n=1 Tax=Bradyrhizobium TaxID=374 RepID=UPI001E354F31|nr:MULTISPECIES: hypothetical protein [Bradyrhizobium]MCC8955309.1 hypothetical protein [Bradyrhizobium altum]MCC8965062.1 hypothetical protein [Bradyrhizobium oropedii]
MTAWRPATHEIDPLLEAVADAARATILPTASIDMPPPSADGIRSQRLRDGRELRLKLSTHCLGQEQRGPRAVLVYALKGSVVVDNGTGYGVTGRAVLDVATRAFLDVSCQLKHVGAVTP